MPGFFNTFYNQQEQERRRRIAMGLEADAPFDPVVRDNRGRDDQPLHIAPPSPNPNYGFGGGGVGQWAAAAKAAAQQQQGGNDYSKLPTNAPPGGFIGFNPDGTPVGGSTPAYEAAMAERARNLNTAPTPWQRTQAPSGLQGISDSDLFQLYIYGNTNARAAAQQMITSKFGNQVDVNRWLNQYGPGGQFMNSELGGFTQMRDLHNKYGFGGQPPAPAPVVPPPPAPQPVVPPTTDPAARPTPTVGGGPTTTGTGPLSTMNGLGTPGSALTWQPPTIGGDPNQKPLLNPPQYKPPSFTGGTTGTQYDPKGLSGFTPVNTGPLGYKAGG